MLNITIVNYYSGENLWKPSSGVVLVSLRYCQCVFIFYFLFSFAFELKVSSLYCVLVIVICLYSF